MTAMSVGHPRVSVNSICSYHQPLTDDVALWRELGVTYIGTILPKIEEVGWDTARALITGDGLRVSTIFGPTYCPLDSKSTPESSLSDRMMTIKTLEFAASIGAESVYVCSGGAASLTWTEAADAFCEMIGPAVDVARQIGVKLLLESTNPLRCDVSFVFWQRDSIDLARTAGTSIMLDLQTAWYERGLEKLVRDNLDLVALVQISDYIIGTCQTGDRAVPGDGDIPLERIISMLLDAGYEGSFDLEVMGPRAEAEGYASNVRRSLERASEMLARLGA
jgi:sugar phosphate isomerase/epimerase